jgi:flagellar protein FliL
MEEERDDTEQGDKRAKSGKSFLRFIVVGVAIVVLGVAGFEGWRLFVKGSESETPATSAPSETKEKEASIAFPLEPFIVNLMDRSGLGRRYLKVAIVLELDGEAGKQRVEAHSPELKDTILLLLSSQFFEDISTVEGKLELKQALISRVNQVLGDAVVRRIYFTEFVVQ